MRGLKFYLSCSENPGWCATRFSIPGRTCGLRSAIGIYFRFRTNTGNTSMSPYWMCPVQRVNLRRGAEYIRRRWPDTLSFWSQTAAWH
jgi:hypothetical protein